MDTPLFGTQDRNEVTTRFNTDGILEITIGQRLDKLAIKTWLSNAAALAGVKETTSFGYLVDQTVLGVSILPAYSQHTHEVQTAVRAYTERFLDTLLIQVSLF